jgi:hypothetical protein
MPSGTLSVIDLLRSRIETVEAYGEDRLYAELQPLLAHHTERMRWFMQELMDRTTNSEAVYGASTAMDMDQVDEFGRAHAKKVTMGTKLGFPLNKWERGLQWTEDYMQEATVGEFAAQYTSILTADRRNVVNGAIRALFNPTNYTTEDVNVATRIAVPIEVKGLLNSDGQPIPQAPNGDTFDPDDHTHYLATASLTAANVLALINTVAEHYDAGTLELAINRAQFATMKTFTANFLAFPFDRVTPNPNADQALGGRRSTMNSQDQEVGIFDDVPVWVRKWVPANYIVCYIRGIGRKVLMMRVRKSAANGAQDFRFKFEDNRHPLRSRTYGRDFGIGVYERSGAAVLRTNNGTYAAPTIT